MTMLQGPWRIELFGGLKAIQGERTFSRFRTEKTGVLLAYLAYHPGRAFSRDELIELLWPESDLAHGRMSLRTALSSLRRQLEPPGTPRTSVLCSDPTQAGLNPAAIRTDVAEFHAALDAASNSDDDTSRSNHMIQAVSVYRGDLLSGYYDNWIVPERERLAASYLSALRKLTRHFVQVKDLGRALTYAQAAVKADSLNEDAHRDVIRLYVALGRPESACQQMDTLVAVLRDELQRPPAESTRQLAEELKRLAPAAHRSRADTVEASSTESVMDRHAETSPPLRRSDSRIPARFTRFFGRSDELARLRGLLSPGGPRIVTLSGPGGTGKTRLALETADSLSVSFHGAVWFVPLEDTTDASVIPAVIAGAMGLKQSPSIPVLDLIASALGELPALIVLDNYEQLVDAGFSIVPALLSRAPRLQCLITSRRRLGLAGEQEIPLSALPIPESEVEPDRLVQVPSVQLYVDRAQAVRPDFQITKGNADAVARLCGLLEGIPLALELAAARSQVLTPSQMIDRLSERFELLAGRRTDKYSRHRSLWAAIDWSYELLSPELRSFFKKLSVFRGGWTASAAEAVAEEPRALDYLTQLRTHSLILAEESRAAFRFRMLDSISEFGREQLSVDECEALEDRHLHYFAMLSESAREEFGGGKRSDVFDDLESEMENLRAALSTGLRKNPLRALGLASNLGRFWLSHGYFNEGRSWIAQTLAHPANKGLKNRTDLEVRANVYTNAGSLAWVQSDFEAARASMEEALKLHRSLNEERFVSYDLMWLGNIAYREGNIEEARSQYEASLTAFRDTDDTEGLGFTLVWLGNVESRVENYSAAEALYEECLNLSRANELVHVEAYALNGLGYAAYRQGQYTESEALHRQCLRSRRNLGDKLGVANSFESLALLAYATGCLDRAATLSAAAGMIRVELGAPLSEAIVREFEDMLKNLRSAVAADRFREIEDAARTLTLDQACDIALESTSGCAAA